MVRPRSCRVIYYFDTPALGRKHQSFGRVIVPYLTRNRQRLKKPSWSQCFGLYILANLTPFDIVLHCSMHPRLIKLLSQFNEWCKTPEWPPTSVPCISCSSLDFKGASFEMTTLPLYSCCPWHHVYDPSCSSVATRPIDWMYWSSFKVFLISSHKLTCKKNIWWRIRLHCLHERASAAEFS
jgi:hypothetical protein